MGERILRSMTSRRRRLLAVGGAALCALVQAAPALAHGTAHVNALDFEARITPSGYVRGIVQARVVDGDRRLDLRVARGHVVVVLGDMGEPLLRFTPNGVAVNEHSPTAIANALAKPGSSPQLDPRARPSWSRGRPAIAMRGTITGSVQSRSTSIRKVTSPPGRFRSPSTGGASGSPGGSGTLGARRSGCGWACSGSRLRLRSGSRCGALRRWSEWPSALQCSRPRPRSSPAQRSASHRVEARPPAGSSSRRPWLRRSPR